ncbi:hypothetical protein AMELA_G00140250 [Ameiurus melas]|uniref:Uncharacterized protein n=1 Tax=Ameiurus melas TaxID=219545 RepID=A0A7J6AKH6_AMEME|nr:hypothetical protein AMELA_G00140250 [Ameiurus melas]
MNVLSIITQQIEPSDGFIYKSTLTARFSNVCNTLVSLFVHLTLAFHRVDLEIPSVAMKIILFLIDDKGYK